MADDDRVIRVGGGRELGTPWLVGPRLPTTVELRGGARAQVRPIRPEDKAALAEAFAKLSEKSRYQRFLTPMQKLSESHLVYFTDVDHHNHEALVAESLDGEGLGVARYVRVDGAAAEVAVTVADHWQRRGVGTALLARLAARAGEEGINCFTATLLASNRGMIALLERLGTAEFYSVGHGVVEARVVPRQDVTVHIACAAYRRRLIHR